VRAPLPAWTTERASVVRAAVAAAGRASTWAGLVALAFLSIAAPRRAFAQGAGATQDPAQASMRLGPVGLTPRLAIDDLGVDSNVFYSPDHPTHDFVAVIAPSVDASMRIGRSIVSGTTTLQYAYFQKTASQRSINLNQTARVDVPFTRIAPYVEGAYLHSRQRPNLEINERVQQLEERGGLGTTVRLGAFTSVDVGADVDRLDYSTGAFGDELLANALNRDARSAHVELHRDLTALTALIVRADVRRDRFEFETIRNTDSLAVVGGLNFQPSALLSGTAHVGFKATEAQSPLVPDFRGFVSDVNVSYVLREMTRFSVKVGRDVDYSFENDWPYFLVTSVGLEIKQAVGLRWDVVARGGHNRLSYRTLRNAGPDVDAHRVDIVDLVGAGVGRHLGDDVRVGVDLNYQRRRSPVPLRAYEGYRLGGSVTYGF
jgi:hypothetical protein